MGEEVQIQSKVLWLMHVGTQFTKVREIVSIIYRYKHMYQGNAWHEI